MEQALDNLCTQTTWRDALNVLEVELVDGDALWYEHATGNPPQEFKTAALLGQAENWLSSVDDQIVRDNSKSDRVSLKSLVCLR